MSPSPVRKVNKKSVRSAAAVITVDFETAPTHMPKRLVCTPGADIAFLVVNHDTDPQRVWIDLEKFGTRRKKSSEGWPQHPFSTAKKLDITVPGGGVGVMRHKVLPGHKFPGLVEARKITYKYSVESESTAIAGVQTLDPDLDVTDPTATLHA